jgi:hypothetical protein
MTLITSTPDNGARDSLQNTGVLLHFTYLIAHEDFIAYIHHESFKLYVVLSHLITEPESYIMTDGQSASLSSNKAPMWDLRPDLFYFLPVEGLLMWGSLSDEGMGLSFTIAPGSRQHSHLRIQVPWDSWPYFTVSD